MLVNISMDRIGALQVDPVSERKERKYKNLIIKAHKVGAPQMHRGWQKEETEEWLRRGSTLYIQRDYEIQEFLDDVGTTQSELEDLESGWDIRKRIDDDLFEHYFEVYNPDVMYV